MQLVNSKCYVVYNFIKIYCCAILAQNFNSIGIAFGSLMAFSSYNRFDNRLMRDTLIISLTDAVTCILAGICVFGTLGNLAYEQGKTVDEVVSSGK
jgi:solute carrier family 6 GABA transporter-like protein 6/8/11/12/13